MALEKLQISVAQPLLTSLQFKDTTPTGTGGWEISSLTIAGDVDIEIMEGYKLELEHHDQGSFGALSFEESLYDNLYKDPKEILAEDWPDSPGEEYPDGIYILKYDPQETFGTDYLTEPNQLIFLLIPHIWIDVTKLLNKYQNLEYTDQKERLKNLFAEIKTYISICKAQTSLDMYLPAVKSFKKLQALVAEAQGEY
jgi:hypothetical protein